MHRFRTAAHITDERRGQRMFLAVREGFVCFRVMQCRIQRCERFVVLSGIPLQAGEVQVQFENKIVVFPQISVLADQVEQRDGALHLSDRQTAAEVGEIGDQSENHLFGKFLRTFQKKFTDVPGFFPAVGRFTEQVFTAFGQPRHPSGIRHSPFVFAVIPVKRHKHGDCAVINIVTGTAFRELQADLSRLRPVRIFLPAVVAVPDLSVFIVADPVAVTPPSGFPQCFRKCDEQPFVSGEFGETFAQDRRTFVHPSVVSVVFQVEGIDFGKDRVNFRFSFAVIAEQFVDGHTEKVRNRRYDLHVGIASAGFPAADRLRGHTERGRKIVLRAAVAAAEFADLGSD